jgi:hypothetical protein
MSEPRWPVFLLDGGDVKVVTGPLSSRPTLERFLADRSLELYDALGRIVRVVVDVGQRSRRLLQSRTRSDLRLEVISDVQHEDHLRRALTHYLQSTGRVVPEQRDLLIFASAAAELIR